MEKAVSCNWDVKLWSCSLWSMKMLGDFFAISCKKSIISPWSLGCIPILITIFCLHNSHCSFRWIVEFSSLPVIKYSVVLLCAVQQLLCSSATVQCFSPNFWPSSFNLTSSFVEFVPVFQTAHTTNHYQMGVDVKAFNALFYSCIF